MSEEKEEEEDLPPPLAPFERDQIDLPSCVEPSEPAPIDPYYEALKEALVPIGKTATIPFKFSGTVGELFHEKSCIVISVLNALREDGILEYSGLLEGPDVAAKCYLKNFEIVGVDNMTPFHFEVGVDAYFNSRHLRAELQNNSQLELRPWTGTIDHRLCSLFEAPSMIGDDPISAAIAHFPAILENRGCDPVSLIDQCGNLRTWLINACAPVDERAIYPAFMADDEGNIIAPVRSLLSIVSEMCYADIHKKNVDSVFVSEDEEKGVVAIMRGPAADRGAAAAKRFLDIVNRNVMCSLQDVQFFISSEHISEDLASTIDPSTPFEFTVWAKISLVYPSDYIQRAAIAMVPDNNFFFTHRLFMLCGSESSGCFDPPNVPTQCFSLDDNDDLARTLIKNVEGFKDFVNTVDEDPSCASTINPNLLIQGSSDGTGMRVFTDHVPEDQTNQDDAPLCEPSSSGFPTRRPPSFTCDEMEYLPSRC